MGSHGCREDAQDPPILVKRYDDGAFIPSATQGFKAPPGALFRAGGKTPDNVGWENKVIQYILCSV